MSGRPTSEPQEISGRQGGEPQDCDNLSTGELYKLSPRRWAILAGICVFGLLNGITNETGSILPNLIAMIGINISQYIYILQLMSYVTPLVAHPTAWFLDKFGLKATCLVGVFLVLIRNGSRALLFSPSLSRWEKFRFAYWIVLGITHVPIVVLYYALPLKVSENWFSTGERSIAWALMAYIPSVGDATAALISPHYIDEPGSFERLANLNLIAFAATLVAICCCVTRSKPEHTPSARRQLASKIDDQSIFVSLRKLFTERNIMIQLMLLVTYESTAETLEALAPDILTSNGFSQVFVGQFTAAKNISASVFCVLGSLKLSRSAPSGKRSARTCKIYSCVISMSIIVLMLTLSLRRSSESQWWMLLVAMISQSSLNSWAAPLYANMIAQLIAGSVSEAAYFASSSVIKCFAKSLSAYVFMKLRTEDPVTHKADYTDSLLIAALVTVLGTLIYISMFRVRSRLMDGHDDDERLVSRSG